MSYESFINETKKVTSTRKHKITGSIGVYDIYKLVRKNKWEGIGHKVEEKLFYAVIRQVNKLIALRLTEGKEIKLPCRMGSLELRKYNTKVDFVNGKLVTNLPIDWNATFKLWYEDEEAKREKLLIRRETKEVYRVVYNKKRANYNNKTFIKFRLNREIKKSLALAINNNSIDAYLLSRYD